MEKPFAADQLREKLGIEQDELAIVRQVILLRMLSREERQAIVTIIHALLEARHGRQTLEAAIEASKAVEELIPSMAADLNESIQKHIPKAKLEEIDERVKRRLPKKRR